MGAPDGADAFVRYTVGELELWVQERVLAKARDPRRLRFHFGRFGWCRAWLEPPPAK